MKRSRKLLLTSVVVLGLAVSAAGVMVGNIINQRLDEDIFFQDRGEISKTPQDYGLPYEDFELMTEDGVALHAWYVPGRDAAGIVMAPGYTDSMSEVLKYASFLNEAGYHLLLFDPRGQGQSEGALYAFGAFEALDIETGMRHLRQARNVEDIALFGHSNGATATLIAAARHPTDIFAVVADSPFANLKLASQSPEYSDPFIETLFPLYAWVAQLRLGFDLFSRTNALAMVDRVSPTLFIHGTQDSNITPFNSQRLYEKAADPKELWLIDGVEHVKAIDTHPDAYARRVLSFLSQFRP